MRLDIEINKQDNPMLSDAALRTAERPPNQYDPPSGKEVLHTWEIEDVPLPFKDEDNLPYMCFTRDGMHAVLHRPLDGVEYHCCFVYHETKGCIFICPCYSNVDANRIYIILAMAAFGHLLLPEIDGEATISP